MQIVKRHRSLHSFILLWLIVPFIVVLLLAVAIIVIVLQDSLTQLVLERHQQLANLAAVTVSQRLEADALALERFRAHPALREPSVEARELAFRQSADALKDFNAGVIQVDALGFVVTAAPGSPLGNWNALPDPGLLGPLRQGDAPIFSDAVNLPGGIQAILVAVPIYSDTGLFSGAVVGAVDIKSPDSSLNSAVQKLTASTPGIAYLLDGQGVVISHPNALEIGKAYQDPSSFRPAVRGSKGGSLWVTQEGERFAGAEAVVEPSGWKLVVEEPWETITAPVRKYIVPFILFIFLTLALFIFLSWGVTRRVTAPIQWIAKNTPMLASGETAVDQETSTIKEIDDLRAALSRMAQEISSYRNGLRHYVDVITRSQEEERLRIARELHDETAQNLLAIYRRMELLSASETSPQAQQQLYALQEMIEQTLQGVRLISQDLRPYILDDLGFVPAVQMLVRKAHEGPGAVPHVHLKVEGEVRPVAPDVELALFRIAQEALNNIRKHSRATSVEVAIQYRPQAVDLKIEDDGIGFAVPSSFTELVQSGHMGLMGIQERVWASGGTLSIDSRADQGTVLSVTIPA